MPAASPTFIETLRGFAAGQLDLVQMEREISRAIQIGPKLVTYESGEPDIVSSGELDAAMYIDFILDEGPFQDLEESRRLAATLAELLATLSSNNALLSDLLQLARWSHDTADHISQYLSGAIDRSRFEHFVSRRPWPIALQTAVLTASDDALSNLAGSLRANDWLGVQGALVGAA